MKFVPVLVALASLALVWAIDLPRLLGAHPWWSGKVVYIGGPIGVGLAGLAGLRLSTLVRVVLFGAVTLAAFWLATSGKADFAASYAADRVAGRIWFIGWIATLAGWGGLALSLAEMLPVFRRADAI